MANSIAVVSNYLGWGVSTVIIPYSVSGTQSLTDLQLYQAIAMSAAFAAFLVFHRESPETAEQQQSEEEEAAAEEEEEAAAEEDTAVRHHDVSVSQELLQLLKNKQYCLQCLCYSILTGVAYSVPGFATTALVDLSLTVHQSAWVNFSFVFAGVLSSLLLGRMVTKPSQYPSVLKSAFLISSAGLISIVLLINYQKSIAADTVYALVIVANMITGIGSLSFLGVAFSAAVEATHPVDAEFSGGFIELWVQIWGFLFTYVSSDGMDGMHMFVMVTIPTILCTVAMCTVYRQEYNYSSPETHLEDPFLEKGASLSPHPGLL
jgi:hypothetical protein